MKVKMLVTHSCSTLCDAMDSVWNSLGKNTGVGSHSILQGIFLTWGSIQHCSQILYCLSHQESSFRAYFSSQLFSHVWLFETPWTAACQASLSTTNLLSLLKLMSTESVMPSNNNNETEFFFLYFEFFMYLFIKCNNEDWH